MVTSGFKLFRVLGIPIHIHYTWFIVFSLVVYTLAINYFPYMGPYYSHPMRWIMAVLAAIILFSSILLHELAHSYIAQREGITISSITLFVFGGIAKMAGETKSPKGEMKIAIAGPALSLILAVFFWIIAFIFKKGMAASPVLAISYFLATSNTAIAIFNLFPGFPLDGGRLLRAAIWHKTGNLNKATLISSRIGKGFAMFLIAMGLWDIVHGEFIGGLWAIFIGMFLQQVAGEGYKQTVLHNTLAVVKVRDIMVSPVVVIDDEFMALEKAVNDYFFRYRYNSFPILSDNILLGTVSLNDVKNVEKEKWPEVRVRDIMCTDPAEFTISPELSAEDALDKMVEDNRGRLVVIERGHIIGIISQRDIMHVLKLKTDLGK